MSALAGLQEERKQYEEQRDIVLGQMREDPDNADLKELVTELNNFIALLDENIEELQSKRPKQPAEPNPPEPLQPEKWSRENHPAFKKAAAVEEREETPVNYQVNDVVMAKWVTGDRGFYPAKIASITGSSTAPIYILKFKSYNTTETLRSKDIRPLPTKRKADGNSIAASNNSPASPAPGVVSSAGATLYHEAKQDSQNDADAQKPPKAKKIKAKKELEANKSKWQEFNTKSKAGKSRKKESMFRTPEGIHGRVGFTGSGQAMRKDPARIRPQYMEDQDLD